MDIVLAVVPFVLVSVLGLGYGYISSKGQFCMNSGFSNTTRTGDFTKLKSFLLVILIQLAAISLLFSSSFSLGDNQSQVLAVGSQMSLLASVLGGFIFGISMYFAGGCGAGLFYKIGEKNKGAIIAIIGFALGIYFVQQSGVFLAIEWLRDYTIKQPVVFDSSNSTLSMVVFIGAILGIFALLYFSKNEKPLGAQWGWKHTGMAMALVFLVAWWSIITYLPSFRMGIVPGIQSSLNGVVSASVIFVIAIALGAFAVNPRKKASKWPSKEVLFKRFGGGLGLGLSAVLAGGCTLGHGLTLSPLLAVASLASIAAMYASSAMVGFLTRK